MQPSIALKDKIRGPGLTLGMLITNHLWLDLIETAIAAGLDYVVIDAEHLQHDSQRIADACQLGRVANFPVLLRPARTDAASIRIAMDLGPCGLLLPMIESAAQLQEVQAGVFMPPRGQRRPGGPGNRWVSSYDYATFKAGVEDHVIIIPQIEGVVGLSNAKEIAAHPLVTALGVGPFDLSAGLGLCWRPQDPGFRAAMDTIRQAAEAAGKPLWMIGDAAELAGDGHRFLCIGEATGILQAALTSSVVKLRRGDHPLRDQAESGNGATPYASIRLPNSSAHEKSGRNGDGRKAVEVHQPTRS